MAKVILTIEDDADGGVQIRTDFEPELDLSITTELSDAQYVALQMLSVARGLDESSEEK